ncbi:MAG: tetratricopeptide repeat protein, partial [Sandaracinaceae bacterium]
ADEQLDAYRFAACVSLMEVHGLDYFDRASVYGREEEALRLLERRVVGAGERSSGPARSLFQAHVSAGHPERGIAVLEAAAKTRPDDGTLAIALVDAHRAHGTTEDAERWLARAETLSVRSDALALARATLARARGDLDAAIAAVDEALSVLPGTPSLVFRRAELVMVREGPTAALAYWESVVDAHPHEPSFLHQLCTQLRTVDDERERGLLQRRLDENREDAWARRELALVLLRLQDDAAALAQADEAIARAPYDPTNHWARGVVLDAMGRDDDARAAHRRAIELSSDAVYSIQALAHLGTAAQVRESARWVLERLSERPGSGVGIAEAFQLSRGLDHEERSAALQRMLDRAPARPDAWEAIARARLEAGDVDGAAEIVERAQALFPRWFSLMRLHAEVLGARGDVEGRVAALRELVVLAPDWTQARVELVSALRASGQFDEALEALDAGLRQTPLDPGLRQQQASLRWREGDREGAFELLLELLREDMLGERQGMTLMAWARALSREDEVDAVLSRWIEARPTATIFPFWRSELRSAPQHEALRVAALEAVLAIDPRDIPARDALAELLASRGEFDAAIATCRLPGGAETPVELRGRAAWVVMYRGDRDEAIAQMRALLEEWPGYGWGHRTLCDWLDAAKDQAGFLSAARALVKQLPSVGLHHVYLGDALASTGAMDDAIASWTRAVELDPYNDYAVRRLMNELLSRDRVDEATALLDRARHALPQADAELLVVRVAVKSARWEDAFRAYETLLGLQGASSSHLFDALSAVATGPREDDAFAAAYEQLFADDPPSGDAIGSAWANAAWTRVSENAPLRLFEHAARLGRAGHAAIAWGIETLANRDRTFGLYWTWLRHRSVMRGVDMLWGAFGYAMYTVQHPWLAMRWLDDWKERTAIRGWMLCNYLLASWANGEPARAREAVEHALTLTADHTLYIHQAWDVFHRSLDAPSSELRARIDGLNVSDDASCGALVPLVHALADAEALGPEADAVARVRAARPRLMDAHAWIGGTPAFRHAYRATARALLARGPWYARLWAWLTWLPPTSG